MMRWTPILAAALLVVVAGAAPAAGWAADERILTLAYKPDDVVRIEGRMGVQATISFGEGEHIENVAIGDAEKWQITPNKRADLLFVKPLGATARTNMTVVTDQHTYFFDLVADSRARPLYLLRFTYPGAAKPQDTAAKAALAAKAAEASLDPAERQLLGGEAPVDPAMLNFAWKRQGTARLLPARVYDDGSSTYLLWSADQQIPAILIRNDRNEEGPVNFAVRGNTIVLDSVPRVIVLRAGKAQALLENQADPRKAPLPATTPAPSAPAATPGATATTAPAP